MNLNKIRRSAKSEGMTHRFSDLMQAWFALALLGMLAGSGEAQNRVVRPATNPTQATETGSNLSSISGQAGDVTRTLERDGFVRSIEIGELGDRPCYVFLRSHAGQPFRQAVRESSQCNGRINTSQYWEVSVASDYEISGLQACYNRSTGRLKGLRVFDNSEYGNVESEIQPNCRGNRGRWADRVDCDEGTYLQGLRIHFRQQPRGQINPVIGVQMMCQRAS